MSFLNVALLGGVAALLAPLLIHLLNRSRFQVIDWGAMHLLESALQQNARRTEWKEWLLLLIRCLIPVVLAVCLARPVLTSFKVANADGSRGIVLIIDDSLSMSKAARQSSVFESAVSTCREIVTHYRQTETSLWTACASVDVLSGSSSSTAQLQSALDGLQVSSGSMDPKTCLADGIRAAAELRNPSRHIVLVSDFLARDWNDLTPGELASLQTQLSSGEFPIHLTFLDASQIDDRTRSAPNLTVRFVDEFQERVQPSEQNMFSVEVVNFAARDQRDLELVFSVNGQQLSRQSVDVPAGGSEQVIFACEFTTAGWHSVQCQVEDPTGLVGDNTAYRMVQVGNPVEVLLVTGQASPGFDPQSSFVQLALAPFGDEEQNENRFRVRTIRSKELRPKDLSSVPDVVILSGAGQLNQSVSESIAELVEAGTGLVVLPDEDLDTAWMNRAWFDARRLLPMAYGSVIRPEQPLPLLQAPIQYPYLDVFDDGQAGDLSRWRFRSWRELTPGAEQEQQTGDSPKRDSPRVLLQFADGSPCLANGAYGDGVVHQLAISGSSRSSNLPSQASFVPFVQQLTRSASGSSGNGNLLVGQPLDFQLASPEGIGAADEELKPTAIELVPFRKDEADIPASSTTSKHQVPVAELRAQFDGLYQAGLWSARPAVESDATVAPAWSVTPPMLAVNPALEESDLQPLSGTQLQSVADALGASVVSSASEFISQLQVQRDGREIWRWLLVALLVLLFAEILLGRNLHPVNVP